MDTPQKTFLYFLGGIPQKILSEAETRALLGATATQPDTPVVDSKPPVIVAPEPAKSFGYPRKTLGTNADGYPMLQLTGIPFPAVQTSADPDTLVFKGTNYPYKSATGVPRLTGYDTAWTGNVQPPLPVRPTGYQLCFFDGQADQPYWKLSSDPDHVATKNLDKAVKLFANEPTLDIQHINLTSHAG